MFCALQQYCSCFYTQNLIGKNTFSYKCIYFWGRRIIFYSAMSCTRVGKKELPLNNRVLQTKGNNFIVDYFILFYLFFSLWLNMDSLSLKCFRINHKISWNTLVPMKALLGVYVSVNTNSQPTGVGVCCGNCGFFPINCPVGEWNASIFVYSSAWCLKEMELVGLHLVPQEGEMEMKGSGETEPWALWNFTEGNVWVET